MKANRFADFGKWLTTAGGIQPGKTYRFEALYRPENIAREDVSVAVILSWCKRRELQSADPKGLCWEVIAKDGWRTVGRSFEAPEGVRSVRVERDYEKVWGVPTTIDGRNVGCHVRKTCSRVSFRTWTRTVRNG